MIQTVIRLQAAARRDPPPRRSLEWLMTQVCSERGVDPAEFRVRRVRGPAAACKNAVAYIARRWGRAFTMPSHRAISAALCMRYSLEDAAGTTSLTSQGHARMAAGNAATKAWCEDFARRHGLVEVVPVVVPVGAGVGTVEDGKEDAECRR